MAIHHIAASIWLRLGHGHESTLRGVIERLARRHGTQPFTPHLTVCGSRLDATSFRAASAYIRERARLPLAVKVEAIASGTGNPFEAVFIRVASSPELSTFRENLRRITGAGDLRPPHVSLFYGVDLRHTVVDLGAAVLDEIAAECRGDLRASEYVLERPAIAYPGTGGDWLRVSEWRTEDL